jgi:hypothetical protein
VRGNMFKLPFESTETSRAKIEQELGSFNAMVRY